MVLGNGNSERLDCAVFLKNERKVLTRDDIYIRFGVQLLWVVMVFFFVNCHYLGALS